MSLRPRSWIGIAATAVLAWLGACLWPTPPLPAADERVCEPVYRSPNHLCVSADGLHAYVVNQTADSVSILDLRARASIGEIAVGAHPSHAVLSRDGRALYVSCTWAGRVDVVDLAQGRVARSIPTGDEPYGVSLSADGRKLFVVNSLSDTLSVIDPESGRTVVEVPVGHAPRYAAETSDGAQVVVANGLSRSVSRVDPAAGQELERRELGRASILRQIVCTPDARWAFVAGILSHDETLSLQMERGWIHSNGITVVDLARPGHRVTLLLDRLLAGASNPWGMALSADGTRLYVTLAGVHEVALVDVKALLTLVGETTPESVKAMEENVEILEQRKIARRVDAGGLGPRGLALNEAAGELLVTNYFSDAVSVLDAATGALRATIPLGPPQAITLRRKGELLFNDARITYQHWFSCASCHQEDATVDGLNWDLPNDGLGNAKNAKSLHDAYDTPPAMWSGVRADMEAAVAAGQRFQGFLPDPENHRALMAYFTDPQRAPNPWRGRDREAQQRGEKLFAVAGCDLCHPAPKFADGKLHDLGFGTRDDFRSRFDTPSLRECYRTGPWLHDGRAKTLHEIFTQYNPDNVHGRTRGFSPQELDDLIAYLKGL